MTTKRCHTGLFTRAGLNDIQISEPSARMVGMSRSRLRSLTVSASSIQQCVRASKDLMRSGDIRRPAKMNSEPFRPLISASVDE